MVCDEFSFSTGDEGQGTLGCSPYREFYPDEEKTGDSGWLNRDVGGAGYPQLCLRA